MFCEVISFLYVDVWITCKLQSNITVDGSCFKK